MSNALTFERLGTAALIRFNRPELRNPLPVDALAKLSTFMDDVEGSSELAALIFTGRGNVFASGADLREIASLRAETAAEFALRGQKLMNRIAGLRQKTIAAVNGYCFGGALDLALACDFRIASPNATFAHPGAELGIITGWGGTQRLPRLIGQTRALEMFFEAKRVAAGEAAEWGLVDCVSEDPLAEAMRISII